MVTKSSPHTKRLGFTQLPGPHLHLGPPASWTPGQDVVWLEQLLSLQTQASPFALCTQTPRSTLNAPAPPPLLCLSQSSGENLGIEGKDDSKRNAHVFDKQNRQLQEKRKKNRLTSSTSFHKRCGGGGGSGRAREAGFVLSAGWDSPVERHPHLQLHSLISSSSTPQRWCTLLLGLRVDWDTCYFKSPCDLRNDSEIKSLLGSSAAMYTANVSAYRSYKDSLHLLGGPQLLVF